jgi:hypothetical protein
MFRVSKSVGVIGFIHTVIMDRIKIKDNTLF